MRHKLWIRLIAIAATTGGLAAIPSPAAQADTCVVSVTVAGGQTLTFTVNVPPGTPLSSIPLPVKLPVASVSESCSSADSGTTPTSTTPTTTAPGTTSTAAPATATTPAGAKGKTGKHGKAKAKTKKGSSHARPGKPGASSSSSSSTKAGKSKPAALRGAGGVPSVSNPTFSFALPGPAPLGVPNFFINSFAIPPFLLPIYQAAGIEYDVPWQVLAAINEIETDYGRNLSVSSAGAVGWMQFLPSTWKRYGVDATGSGYADPYNPVDAIFSAARYLQAAGAARNLGRAIFAYNHAGWYVQSVLLRAQLIGGMPHGFIGALTGLVQGHFPVAAPAKYADDQVERLAMRRVHRANAAIPITSDPTSSGTAIYAAQGSPVIAVNDGRIVRVGRSAKLGRYVVLQDQTGNTYTYANLGSVPRTYPVPRPVRITAADVARELSVAPGTGGKTTAGVQRAPAPTGPASAGTQTSGVSARPLALPLAHAASHTLSLAAVRAAVHRAAAHSRPARADRPAPAAAGAAVVALPKVRLFAHPARPASFAAGGQQQLAQLGFAITRFQNYFSDVLHLGRHQYTLAPLRKGAIVVAGTVLGRIGADTATSASHLYFMVQPAGTHAPYIDPKPILDGWKLLEATAVYRAANINPFVGRAAGQATIGQILLESKTQLQQQVLADPHASIYQCGRRDIQAGLIDRRILATIEFLSASGLDPTVTGLQCGATQHGTNGIDATTAQASGDSMDISQINGIPIQGHQGAGSITDITIRRLLTLQGAMAPSQIISLMSYKGQPSTLSLPDHANRIQIAYTPAFGTNKKLAAQTRNILRPHQWIQLIQRISQIPEPSVPTAPSRYAIRTARHG